jgi:hypothetical protein
MFESNVSNNASKSYFQANSKIVPSILNIFDIIIPYGDGTTHSGNFEIDLKFYYYH